MKRLFLMLVVFLISATTCFAYNKYREILHGTDIYDGKFINVNAYCYEITLYASWNGSSEGTYGNVQCGEASVGANIAEYTWLYDGTSSSGRYQTHVYGKYFGTIALYLEAFQCYGQVELIWEI